ncbi:DUF6932 family protein [Deinococcus sp. A31D244]|uniref:DUF6932 family protein n=1 Tax=Deinococcus sp. A31D244 TaxID=3397675 RepID=UPI0039DF2BB5
MSQGSSDPEPNQDIPSGDGAPAESPDTYALIPPLVYATEIPPLNKHGMLPTGVYLVTLDQIQYTFGTSTPRRAELWAKFMTYLELLRATRMVRTIYIDGSFTSNTNITTGRDEPGDIDVVADLVPPPEVMLYYQSNPSALVQATQLLDHDSVKATYEVDVWKWFPGIPPRTDYDLVDFFQKIRPSLAARLGIEDPTYRKGILRVIL